MNKEDKITAEEIAEELYPTSYDDAGLRMDDKFHKLKRETFIAGYNYAVSQAVPVQEQSKQEVTKPLSEFMKDPLKMFNGGVKEDWSILLEDGWLNEQFALNNPDKLRQHPFTFILQFRKQNINRE